MALQDAVLHFVQAHSSLLAKIEQLAVHELIEFVKYQYPNDPTLIAIITKISDEFLKLQGINQQ